MSAAHHPRSHYSYTVYADPATAATFDARRFGGPIGELLLERQDRLLEAYLGDPAARDVVDVGAGTGRAALALARRGARVTAVDASPAMLRVARERAAAVGVSVRFVLGDAHALALPDRSVDAAVCLRVLMHARDWRRSLAELCRVARDRVVVDYPALASGAALQAVSRRVRQWFDPRVEAYRVIGTGAVRQELARNGFAIAALDRQFVLPIAFHKMVGSRSFTEQVERSLARARLAALLGSPVTVLARRVR